MIADTIGKSVSFATPALGSRPCAPPARYRGTVSGLRVICATAVFVCLHTLLRGYLRTVGVRMVRIGYAPGHREEINITQARALSILAGNRREFQDCSVVRTGFLAPVMNSPLAP